jgi:hypothetical protein
MLTEQQKAFVARFLGSGLLSKRKNKKTLAAFEIYANLETQFKALAASIPKDHAPMQSLIQGLKPILAAKDKGDFKTASVDLHKLITQAQLLKDTLIKQRQALLTHVDGIALASGTPVEARQAIEAAKNKVRQALSAEVPSLAQMTEAKNAVVELTKLVKDAATAVKTDLENKLKLVTDPTTGTTGDNKALAAEREKLKALLSKTPPSGAELDDSAKALLRLQQMVAGIEDGVGARNGITLEELKGKSPKAAAKARTQLKAFASQLDGKDIDEAAYDKAQEDLKQAHQQWLLAQKAASDAQALPQGTPEQIQHRNAEILRTTQASTLAKTALDNTTAKSNAAMGHKLLSEALAFGPLSSELKRPISDEGAESIIAAYAKDPRLADSALKTACHATHPELIAQNIGAICDMSNSGMASSGGRHFTNPDYGRTIAQKYVEMGGNVGAKFFDELPGYVAAGHQFTKHPFGDDNSIGTFPELAQHRNRGLAKAMFDTSGNFDPAQAKVMALHLMMNPDVLRNPTPELANHVNKTLDVFTDGTTGPLAKDIIDQADTSANDPSALALTRKALGKGDTDTVSDQDVKASILTAMLTPMNQGPVGSCFSTAPCRRLRHDDPIGTMERFAELSTKGTFTTHGGDQIPAVTNLPEGENPLLRSLEYTLATAGSREGGSYEQKALNKSLDKGLDALNGLVEPIDWPAARQKLLQDINAALTFVYDPVVKSGPSNDGSSSEGRYVLQLVSDKSTITTEKQFVDTITELAIDSLGHRGDTDSEDAIRSYVEHPDFIAAVCPGEYKPWELSSGGISDQTITALQGGTVAKKPMIGEVDPNNKPPVGERTRAVLQSIVKSTQGCTDDMFTIDTVGQHSFNVLAQHPSLAELQGGTESEVAKKVEDKLIKPGQKLRDHRMPADQAAHLFKQDLKKRLSEEGNSELKTLLTNALNGPQPDREMTPAQLDKFIKAALAPFNARSVELEAQTWQTNETSASRTVTPEALEKKKAALKADFDRWLDNSNQNLLIGNLGAPEFVVADTNWGDSRSHTYFVIAPNPVTGEPQLWQKDVPPGTMTPKDRDWIDRTWAKVE